MRICIVGGIFAKPAAYAEAVKTTPETVLARGLRERGHHVDTRGHHGPFDYHDADVVHVHHLSWGALVAASAETPFVFTSHWLRHKSASRRAIARFVVASADASITLSETERRWQELHTPTAGRTAVIPNGIDPNVFRFVPPPLRPRAGPWDLLYVGQLARFKGLDYLFQALARLKPVLKVRLRLVFQVADEEHRLRSLSESLGIDVDFLGSRDPQDLAQLYAQCHALVLPSTGEALPSVISEAQFVGRPTVGTDVGAVREQIGDFGRVVPPRNAWLLADAIQDLTGNYDDLAAMADEASRNAVATYSVESMLSSHEQLYTEVIGSPRGRRRRALLNRSSKALARGAARWHGRAAQVG